MVSRRRIARRVEELGQEVSAAYRGKELTILAAMTGSLVFLADLVRRLPLTVRIEVIMVSSYPGKAMRSRGVKVRGGASVDLAGREVLVVDDILDSGQTLRKCLALAAGRKPRSLRSCVLLRKSRPNVPDRPAVDYVGFDIADEFVVGYGLDYNNLYRNLPDLCVLKDRCLK